MIGVYQFYENWSTETFRKCRANLEMAKLVSYLRNLEEGRGGKDLEFGYRVLACVVSDQS